MADGGAHVGCSCGRLREWPYVFMRWMERFFVNVGEDCGAACACAAPFEAARGKHEDVEHI